MEIKMKPTYGYSWASTACSVCGSMMGGQSQMKPTYGYSWASTACSVCGSLVGEWEESPNYCPNCGQAIDWSEE